MKWKVLIESSSLNGEIFFEKEPDLLQFLKHLKRDGIIRSGIQIMKVKSRFSRRMEFKWVATKEHRLKVTTSIVHDEDDLFETVN